MRELCPIIVFLSLALWCAPVEGQTESPAPADRLRVHLDCQGCFEEYLRSEIRWVDFVRQPQDADVQVLSSNRETGGGGREYVLRFVGLGRFGGIGQELRAISAPAESEDVRRRGVLTVVSVGLLAYAARSGLPSTLAVSVRQAQAAPASPAHRDRWNLWVFSVSGEGAIDAEESNRALSWEGGITADRITDRWKISVGVNVEHETERFDVEEEDEEEAQEARTLTVRRRERELDWFVARSLGEHWSVGLDGSLEASTFANIKRAFELAPAVEYNLFPYSQYASRQLRFQYSAGLWAARYYEVTLFDRIQETRPQHALSVALDQREPWGTMQAGIEWSQYLHDRSKYRLEVEGEVSFRIVRGLSVEIDGSASRLRDQLSLRRRGATPEEVLLRLRELQSGYEVSFSAGFRYTFGSIFNNIVNPRFGR